MTTGTEGDDNLQNDDLHDVIDARGGNDVITIVARPSNAPTTASVDGGTGFDILQASGGQMTATSVGQFTMRSGSSLHVFVTYTNVERLILSGRYVNTDPFVTGDTQDWLTFTGTGGARVIVQSGGGDDRVFLTGLHVGGDIDVGSGNDHVDLSGASPTNNPSFTIIGGDGSDLLIGSTAPDTIDGGEGIDSLNGLDGADVLRGGTGNDFYQVDTVDVVEELIGGGFDYVYVRASYTLPTDAEVEAMATTDTAGTSYLLLRGNGFNNAITGNAGDNSIDGLGGDDYLVGLEGNDRLDGGTGADFMVGGTGNDIYIVDHHFDEVRDFAGEGLDYLFTSTDYALRPGVEIELFATSNYLLTTPLFLTGNELNNAITGNNGNNQMSGEGGDDHITGLDGDDIMDGGSGVDWMVGGIGNDVYYVDNAGDVAVEGAGEGFDSLYTSASYRLTAGAEIELLGTRNYLSTAALDIAGNEHNNIVIGSNGANVLEGLGGSDSLSGLDGNDVLDGGAGQDFLEGGAGADVFRFTAASDSAPGAADRITDFVSGTDRIDLSAIDANSGVPGDQAFTYIGSGAFTNSAGQLRVVGAGTGVWEVQGDINGDGVADLLITVFSAQAPVAGDFIP